MEVCGGGELARGAAAGVEEDEDVAVAFEFPGTGPSAGRKLELRWC